MIEEKQKKNKSNEQLKDGGKTYNNNQIKGMMLRGVVSFLLLLLSDCGGRLIVVFSINVCMLNFEILYMSRIIYDQRQTNCREIIELAFV